MGSFELLLEYCWLGSYRLRVRVGLRDERPPDLSISTRFHSSPLAYFRKWEYNYDLFFVFPKVFLSYLCYSKERDVVKMELSRGLSSYFDVILSSKCCCSWSWPGSLIYSFNHIRLGPSSL